MRVGSWRVMRRGLGGGGKVRELGVVGGKGMVKVRVWVGRAVGRGRLAGLKDRRGKVVDVTVSF